MSARHIVFATIGSLGDLHPMMTLATELQERGHTVTLATSAFYRHKVESSGIRFHPIRPDLSPDDKELLQRAMELKSGPEFLIREVILPHLRDMYDDLAAIAQHADMLIAGEVVFAAPLVAEKFELRWASAILSPCSFLSIHDPSVIPQLPFSRQLFHAGSIVQRVIAGLGGWITRDWATPIEELRAELGLAQLQLPIFMAKYSPHFNLALFSPAFAKPQSDWPSNTQQTGFIFYEQQADCLPAAIVDFLKAGEPPLLFTLGSAAVQVAGDFYEISVKVSRKLGLRAILLVGDNAPPVDLPSDIVAVDYLPYRQIFPHVACVVHQGGIGTTAQALQAGRPQLVMPFSFDQPDNAARVERLGVGLMIEKKQYSTDLAAKQLNTLLTNPGYAHRAKEVAGLVANEDGLHQACDAIEGRLAAMPNP